MWYYRTEVANKTDEPLTILWFEGYTLVDGEWRANNVKGRPLNKDDFAEWYTEGTPCINGVIPPRGLAACDPNWHGATTGEGPPIKWAYQAIDTAGKKHYAEGIITSAPIAR